MKLLSKFSQLKVLIVGDVMLDHYVYGHINRISPEAPVPIVEVKKRVYAVGGAANVALNIHALGATPFLCSVIGQDEIGRKLLDNLNQKNIDTANIISSKNRKTTSKKRILAQQQQLMRIDEEDTHSLNQEDTIRLLNNIERLLQSKAIDVLLFQDYNKGVLFPTTIHRLLEIARQKEIYTVVDPKQAHFFDYQGVTLFKPNLREIRQQLPFPISPTRDDLKKATVFLKEKLNHKETLITLSEQGLFYDNGSSSMLMPTTPRTVADVCGAGDTVISVAALGIAANLDRTDIALLCNLAGGQVCEQVGVVPVDITILEKDYTISNDATII